MSNNSVSRRVPKQARSQQRYDEILDAAANLFLHKGFDGTSTNEIARSAGVSIGSLYQYFGNKEAVVEALSHRYVEALRELTARVVATDIGDLPVGAAIDNLVDPIVEFHFSNPAFAALWLGTDVSKELKASMSAMDDEVLARIEGLIEARVPGMRHDQAQMIGRVIQSTVKSLLGLLIRSDDPAFKAQAATEMKRMLVAYIEGIIADRGRGA